MMKKIFGVIIFILCFPTYLTAEVIYLKDGSVIKGKVIEQDSAQIKIKLERDTLSLKLSSVNKIVYEEVEVESKVERKESSISAYIGYIMYDYRFSFDNEVVYGGEFATKFNKFLDAKIWGGVSNTGSTLLYEGKTYNFVIDVYFIQANGALSFPTKTIIPFIDCGVGGIHYSIKKLGRLPASNLGKTSLGFTFGTGIKLCLSPLTFMCKLHTLCSFEEIAYLYPDSEYEVKKEFLHSLIIALGIAFPIG